MSTRALLNEFKPTILFLAKFLATYLILNFGYGVFIEYYAPWPDPVTRMVTQHSTWVLQLFGSDASYVDSYQLVRATVDIQRNNETVLQIFEGCNGLNVAIIYVAFLLAYGKLSKKLWWFIPLGLIIIHLTNLGRISFLYGITLHFPDLMYFAHKYLFTAIIYLIVFFLWYLWLNRIYVDKKRSHASENEVEWSKQV